MPDEIITKNMPDGKEDVRLLDDFLCFIEIKGRMKGDLRELGFQAPTGAIESICHSLRLMGDRHFQ